MTRLELEGVVDDRLGPLTLRLNVGLSVVVSDEIAPLGRLLDVAGGARRPRRGSARLDGVNVHDSARARRGLAALFAQEELVPSRTLGEAARLAWELRGVPGNAAACLEEWGLARLLETDPRRLDAEQRRAVALVLALGARASVLTLYDPLALAPLLGHARIREACWRAAQSAIVFVGTPLLDDATELGGNLVLLTRGRFAAAALAPAAPAAAAPAAAAPARANPTRPLPREVLVRCADCKRLAELLRADATLEVGFDETRTARELFVRGPSHAQITANVLRVAREAELTVEALAPLAVAVTGDAR